MKYRLLALAFFLFTTAFSQEKEEYKNIINTDSLDINKLRLSILEHLNSERETASLNGFSYSNELQEAAQYHCSQMHEYNFFSHVNNYDDKMRHPVNRILAFEGNFPFIAENISNTSILNYPSNKNINVKNENGSIKYYNPSNGAEILNHSYESLANKIVDKWMGSENHRKNILNPDLQQAGIGVVIIVKGKDQYLQNYVLITLDMGGL